MDRFDAMRTVVRMAASLGDPRASAQLNLEETTHSFALSLGTHEERLSIPQGISHSTAEIQRFPST